ncbi:methyl-cpg-binding protein, putative [Pediculus humanus corporis]|uniref:Methyl-cpg-binding protein, putative n=1 Tax=Pediculus humanus subsp. corporis TaxID=121224 RepID=E0VME0_PEDHC|nr:methyl-cpg-binding protein, putative [Pediculus humanus corporis]EEB14546.1 methyl-cpg-binding protein, putative [Pediculus humanus corporis]
MKSSEKVNEKIGTTTQIRSSLSSAVNKSSYLLNQISKLSADHDVTVSGTMIKVTYKKALKHHFSSPKFFDRYNLNDEILSRKSMSTFVNKLDSQNIQSGTKGTFLSRNKVCGDNIILSENKPAYIRKDIKHSLFHSTPKSNLDGCERDKREFVNELSFIVELDRKNHKKNPHISIFQPKPTFAMDSNHPATSYSGFNSKPPQLKMNSDEISSRNSIKIPKGITIIRLKGNTSTKNGDSSNIERNLQVKPKTKKVFSKSCSSEIKNYQLGEKRKINLDDEIVATKIIKKNVDVNSQYIKKKIVKQVNILNKKTNSNETIKNSSTLQESTINNLNLNTKKEVLMEDPDLPAGWKRVVFKRYEGTPKEKKIVYIHSPNGKKFQFKWKLKRYLEQTKSKLNPEQFHFGLYKRSKPYTVPSVPENEEKMLSENVQLETDNSIIKIDPDKEESLSEIASSNEDIILSETDTSKFDPNNAPKFKDPTLPPGWKRCIKIRSCGKSAGRMEVIIVSPDGKRHRSKKQLENYILKNKLNFNSEDFDFSVFGKTKKTNNNLIVESKDTSNVSKKKPKPSLSLSDRPVPDLDINGLKSANITRESEMINTVNGIMVSCDLSSSRTERRLRLPKNEHEKLLKNFLESQNDADADGDDARKTKEFLKELSSRAYKNSVSPEAGLQYDDIANLVDKSQCLSSLKTLIPKKMTYKEYIKLNRPKHFMSFT